VGPPARVARGVGGLLGGGLKSRHRLSHRLVMIARLVFGRRYVANRFEQPAVVEPIDPVERREFDRLEIAPLSLQANHLRFEKPDDRFTDAVLAEVTAWQARPLEAMYPVVFFDALRVKIRDEAVVRSKAVYLALAVLPDGSRDILGIWIEQTEGAKLWMKVFTDLKTRG
jgi:hypothetical protein